MISEEIDDSPPRHVRSAHALFGERCTQIDIIVLDLDNNKTDDSVVDAASTPSFEPTCDRDMTADTFVCTKAELMQQAELMLLLREHLLHMIGLLYDG